MDVDITNLPCDLKNVFEQLKLFFADNVFHFYKKNEDDFATL